MDLRPLQDRGGLEQLVRIASALRRRRPAQNLIGEVAGALLALVPADGVRFDLTDDKGALWSRIVRPGSEPERPSLGSVSRLRTREVLETTEDGGTHQVSVPLGIGEPATGRMVLRRRSGAFSEADLAILGVCADLLSLGLRARPFDPPPKPRGPFDEGPLI